MLFIPYSHPGLLCKQVRTGIIGNPSPQEIALRARYSYSMIRKFELGDKTLKQYEGYVNALHLSQSRKDILINICKGYKNKDDEEVRLGHYSFDILNRPRKKNEEEKEEIDKLIDQLEDTPFPAFIMDELWFVHAFNAPILELFSITEEDLKKAPNWHVIATKYYKITDGRTVYESPLRRAHRELMHKYFPEAVFRFLISTSEYFFTDQMLNIQNFLCQLSPDVFQSLWGDLITMHGNLPIAEPIRHIYYKKLLEPISMVVSYNPPVSVTVAKDYRLKFTLVLWLPHPRNGISQRVLEEIDSVTQGKEAAFAYQYRNEIPIYKCLS